MSECKTVTLRTRPLKKGMLSFYLDYYPGYRDQETMKTIRHEGLNIYIYANPKNQRERDFNAAMSEKAEAIRCRRFEAIVNERYDFFDKRKYKADFLEYYRKQLRKHDQKWGFVYQHFYNFVHGKCTFEEIDVDLTKTSSSVKEILFTVSIYWHSSDEYTYYKEEEFGRQYPNKPRLRYNFGQVRDAYIQIKNAITGETICRYDLDEDFSTDKGVEFGRLYRRGSEWKFQAIGDAHTDGLEPICKKYASKFM